MLQFSTKVLRCMNVRPRVPKSSRLLRFSQVFATWAPVWCAVRYSGTGRLLQRGIACPYRSFANRAHSATVGRTEARARTGIGDDCAVMKLPRGHEALVTTDFTWKACTSAASGIRRKRSAIAAWLAD